MAESGELAKIVKAVGRVSIIYGEDAQVPEEHADAVCVYIGKCQRDGRDLGAWVPGCPPSLDVIMDVLREATGLPTEGLPVSMWEGGFDEEDPAGDP
jgi:hypothetical protein